MTTETHCQKGKMKVIFAILAHTFAFVCTLLTNCANATDLNRGCLLIEPIIVQAYTNWPFRIDCNHLKEARRKSQNSNSEQHQCIVTYNGTVFDEGIFELSSVAEDNFFDVVLANNDSQCLSSHVIVQLHQFPEESCDEIVNDSAKRGEVKFLESTVGQQIALRCIPPDGTPTLIPEGANRQDFKTHWYTKCVNGFYRMNNLWRNVPDIEGYPDKLLMPRVDFFDATNFTCAVTYRGRTLYPITYAQCIKQDVTNKEPSIVCTKVESGIRGGSTQLDCAGQIATGTTSPDDFVVEWMRDGKVICQNNFLNQPSPGRFSERISCEVRGNNDSLKCIADDQADDSEIQRSKKILELRMNISRLKDSDYGRYSVSIKYRDDSVWLEDLWDDLILEEKNAAYSKSESGMTVIIIGPVALFVLVVLGVKFRRKASKKYTQAYE